MPLVLVPFVAIAVALVALAIALALTIVVTPIVEGTLRQVPAIGGYLANKVKAGGEWAAGIIRGWANSNVDLVVGWFHGLAQSAHDFVDAVNAYLVALPDHLDHLAHVVVPELIRLAVIPVSETVRLLGLAVDDVTHRVDRLDTRALDTFHGIEHGVDLRVGALRDLIENVDLPDLRTDLEREIGHVGDLAQQGVSDAIDYTDQRVGEVLDTLNRIPLQQLLALLVSVPALASLVQVIESEAGLGNAECRSKVKQICATDPDAWGALLDVAGLAFEWIGVAAFVEMLQELAQLVAPELQELIRGA